MASLGRMTPSGWALAGVHSIIRESFSVAEFSIGIAVMLALSTFLFVIASRRLRTAFIGN
jgi:hypothetical protein